MSIDRTFDEQFITECVTRPEVWRVSADDGYKYPDLYFPPMDKSLYWLRAEEHGVFLFKPHNTVTYEAHTVLMPSARGKAKDLAIAAGEWMFTNTDCQRIITNVPIFNELALRLAKKVGLKEYGVNPKSFLKDGILHDQVLFGINKGELSCQQ